MKSIPSAAMNLSAITSFDGKIDTLSINNSSEASKFEHEPTFENTINEIKDDHKKIIASADMNLSAITSFEDNTDPVFINNSFEAEKFETEPTFENTLNNIIADNLKNITYIDMNVSAITLNKPSSYS